MKNVLIIFLVLFSFFLAVALANEATHASASESFWTPEMKKLAVSLVFSLLLMIVLPMTIHVIDEQLGYFFLFLGGAILLYAISLGIVKYEHGYFVQDFMPHGENVKTLLEDLHHFDQTLEKDLFQKKGKALEDKLNIVYLVLQDAKEKEAFIAIVKEWLGDAKALLKDGRITLIDDKPENTKDGKHLKPFFKVYYVRQLEGFINNCLIKLPSSEQAPFFVALQKFFGEKNLTQKSSLQGSFPSNKITFELYTGIGKGSPFTIRSFPSNQIIIELNPEAHYTYDPTSTEFQLVKTHIEKSYYEGHPHHIVELLREPWMLLICFFMLSLLAFVFQANIKNFFFALAKKVAPETIIFWFVLVIGMLGSVSVVVIAAVGGIFFKTISGITRKDYTPSVICFSANIGISALLTTVGEPLSLFVAKNLGEGTPYLLKTFSVVVVLNSIFLAFLARYFARKAPDIAKTAEELMVENASQAKKAEKKAHKEIGEARRAELTIAREVNQARNALQRAKSALANTKYRKGLEKEGKVEVLKKMEQENNEAFEILKKMEEENQHVFKSVESFDKEAFEALEAAEELERAGEKVFQAIDTFEEEQHSFAHELDRILHATAKLAFFVWGLLFFGEGVKPIAAKLVREFGSYTLFFGNAISAIADNALLGLLEIQSGMAQVTVFTLTLSLAFWGVALVPGNVCNIVLKEALHIKFASWAKYGIPIAVILCFFNFTIVLLVDKLPLFFFPFGS